MVPRRAQPGSMNASGVLGSTQGAGGGLACLIEGARRTRALGEDHTYAPSALDPARAHPRARGGPMSAAMAALGRAPLRWRGTRRRRDDGAGPGGATGDPRRGARGDPQAGSTRRAPDGGASLAPVGVRQVLEVPMQRRAGSARTRSKWTTPWRCGPEHTGTRCARTPRQRVLAFDQVRALGWRTRRPLYFGLRLPGR